MSHIVTDWNEYDGCLSGLEKILRKNLVNQTWICTKSRKCIHIRSRCDQHPHPSCVYEKVGKDGKKRKFAEDEDNCISEYKEKGFVPKVINLSVMCYQRFLIGGVAGCLK